MRLPYTIDEDNAPCMCSADVTFFSLHSLVGLLSLIMEIPFFFKIHAWFEKINDLTSKFQDWHKCAAYFVYVIGGGGGLVLLGAAVML